MSSRNAAQPGGSTDTPIRVIVVDDHDLFRAGLATLLADDPRLEVIGQASGGRAGVRLAAELVPDVVLMDVRMPDLSGPDATREVLAAHPQIRVLALTVAAHDDDVAAALAAGASGFLAKDMAIESLANAIEAAVGGAAWLSAQAADVVLGRLRGAAGRAPIDDGALAQLSGRELEVLRLVAAGAENAEIARALGISPRTVKNHVSSILTKLGLPSRVQAAVFAVRRGIE